MFNKIKEKKTGLQNPVQIYFQKLKDMFHSNINITNKSPKVKD